MQDTKGNEYLYNNQDNIRNMKRKALVIVDIGYIILGVITLYVLISMLGIDDLSMQTIKEHAVTLICSGSIIGMAVWHAIQNRRVYSYIVHQYKDITNKTKFIKLNEQMRAKIRQNPNIKINIQTAIEEYVANELYGKRSLLQIIKGIKAVSSTLIIIGVLGTFMGLVIGLKSFGVQNAEMDIEQIAQFLQGVNTAFYTSIIGILGSLFMQSVIHKYSCEEEIVKWMLKLEIVLSEQIEDRTRRNMMDVVLGMDNKLEILDKSLNVQEDIRGEIKIAVQEICEVSDGLKAIKELRIAADNLNKFNGAFKDNIGSFTGVMPQSFEVVKELATKTSDMSSQFVKLQQSMQFQHDVNVSIRSYMEMTYNNMIDMSKAFKYQENMQKIMHQEVAVSLENLKKQIVDIFKQSQQFEIQKQQGIQNMGNLIQQYIEAIYKQQSVDDTQRQILETIAYQQKQAFEQHISSLSQMGQIIQENIQSMDSHLIQEMALQRQDVNNKVSISYELINEHGELVKELQKVALVIEEKMNKSQQSHVDVIYNDHIVNKLSKAAANMPKEG